MQRDFSPPINKQSTISVTSLRAKKKKKNAEDDDTPKRNV